jgi:hypothetical protein
MAGNDQPMQLFAVIDDVKIMDLDTLNLDNLGDFHLDHFHLNLLHAARHLQSARVAQLLTLADRLYDKFDIHFEHNGLNAITVMPGITSENATEFWIILKLLLARGCLPHSGAQPKDIIHRSDVHSSLGGGGSMYKFALHHGMFPIAYMDYLGEAIVYDQVATVSLELLPRA